MAYSDWDEYLIHQVPTTLDHVQDSDPHWTDRFYFNCHARDGSALLTLGYGVFPNQQRAMGYARLALSDGRHWDASARRELAGDRADMAAGPMRAEVLQPRRRWRLTLGPNPSGLQYDIEWQARAPMWELKPIFIRKRGLVIVNQQHIQQSGNYSGWIQHGDERMPVDGFYGGRDRTWGIRNHGPVDMWIWFAAQFEDRAIAAWLWRSRDGKDWYVDGGFSHTDGSLSRRFVKMDADIQFDGDLRRPKAAAIRFVDEDGQRFDVTAQARHQDVGVYYGAPVKPTNDAVSGSAWNSRNREELKAVEKGAFSLDQLMHYEFQGLQGYGVFELWASGDGYPPWEPNWPLTAHHRLGT